MSVATIMEQNPEVVADLLQVKPVLESLRELRQLGVISSDDFRPFAVSLNSFRVQRIGPKSALAQYAAGSHSMKSFANSASQR